MRVEARDGTGLHVRVDGPEDGAPVIFGNSLGSSLALWDGVIAHLPKGLRLIRYDLRGHGQSDVPAGPYTMGSLISDAEAVCDALAVKDAVFVGLSVGGMVAQGLAVKRLDLVRGLVLSNTAAKIGTPKMWQDRMETVQTMGLDATADTIIPRWFGRDFRDAGKDRPWREMLTATPQTGYLGVCAAIAGTDFYTPTSGLRLPTLGIAGSEDKSTPPDLVRETVALIPGSTFHLMRRLGHLPCVEDPAAFATLLGDFLRKIGHV
jgi:3-oxoadipate enol-lactonase